MSATCLASLLFCYIGEPLSQFCSQLNVVNQITGCTISITIVFRDAIKAIVRHHH